MFHCFESIALIGLKPRLALLQSGGNAIPLGKRKASVAFEPAEDSDDSDVASDTDADEALTGELESDADDFQAGSDEDSQMEAPDSDDDIPHSQDESDASSDDDMPIAAEKQGAAARKAAILPKVAPSAIPISKQAQNRLQQQEQQASSSASEADDSDNEEDEEGAEEASAARRSSHEVCTAGFTVRAGHDSQEHNQAACQVVSACWYLFMIHAASVTTCWSASSWHSNHTNTATLFPDGKMHAFMLYVNARNPCWFPTKYSTSFAVLYSSNARLTNLLQTRLQSLICMLSSR